MLRDAGLQPQTYGLIDQAPHEAAGQIPCLHGQHQAVPSQDAG